MVSRPPMNRLIPLIEKYYPQKFVDKRPLLECWMVSTTIVFIVMRTGTLID